MRPGEASLAPGGPQDVWDRLVDTAATMGPPQTPPPAVVARLAAALAGRPGPFVLLGVTPALAGVAAPLLACDLNPAMVARLWPGDGPGRRAIVADWACLPLAAGGAGGVVGDGAFNALSSIAAVAAVLAELRRVLARGGVAAVRLFARPEAPEPLARRLARCAAGSCTSLNALRWEIAHALAEPPGFAVPVAAILAAAEAALGPIGTFAAARGLEGARHFEAYRGASARYLFPTRAALAAQAAAAGLDCRCEETLGYPGAEHCPIVHLSPSRRPPQCRGGRRGRGPAASSMRRWRVRRECRPARAG